MSSSSDEENISPQVSKPKAASKVTKGKTIEETYTKKTQLEHILLRPDTYIGSVEKQVQLMWVLDAETKQIVNRNCSHVPGLYKIFDEIIVNAADNKQRDPTMDCIKVTINREEKSIQVWNNGNGIPIAIHQEHNIYVPELVGREMNAAFNFFRPS
jgi:DNA topoisomerase II